MTHRYTETVCAVNASYTDLDIPLRRRNSDYAGMEFSKNLKRFREAAGMRQEDVGDVLGVSQVTVGRWEKEQREPSFKDIEALAQVFGVATWDFFTPVEGEPVPSEDEIAAMIEAAMEELPVGVSYGDYPRAVAASVREQLAQYRAFCERRADEDEVPSRDKGAALLSATRQDGTAE